MSEQLDPEIDYQQVEEQIKEIQGKAKEHLTAAYEGFKDRLCIDYLIISMQDQMDGGKFEHMQKALKMIPGNSSAEEIDYKTTCAKLCCFLVFPYIWLSTRTIMVVEANKFAFVVESNAEHGERTLIYGPGYHILGYDYKQEGIYSFEDNFPNNIIQSSVGDLKIAKVDQGFIMYLECGGQNIILGPGIHRITEPMTFKAYISLDSFFINVGPEKWITIPTGYDGISINRGRINVLEGGKQHMLKHVSEKFVKMVPKTIQTDKIPTDIPSYVYNLTSDQNAYNPHNQRGGRHQVSYSQPKQDENDATLFLHTTTAEGSKVVLDTMLQWKIIDTKLASLTAMEILKVESIGNENSDEQAAISASSKNICNLRKTVLRIAKNHLTAMVGSINLAGKSSLSAQIKGKVPQEAQDQQLDDQDDDEQGALLNKKSKQNKNQKEKDNGGAKTNFDILSSLQNGTNLLKDVINEDLIKIGCVTETVCIYRVSPDPQIQRELDRQTKAKVDANTAIIKALSDQKASKIKQEIQTQNALTQAKSNSKVLLMEAESYANAEITKSTGQADAIITVAKARKQEALELQESKIARELAVTREAAEAGSKIFQGETNNFVFGQNPGDVLYNMFGKKH